MTNSDGESSTVKRYYAAEGPSATAVIRCGADYFAECLMSNRGAVTVWLHSGEVEHVAGTRYLDAERIRAEEDEGSLEIIYLGIPLKTYPSGTWDRWVYVDDQEA